MQANQIMSLMIMWNSTVLRLLFHLGLSLKSTKVFYVKQASGIRKSYNLKTFVRVL